MSYIGRGLDKISNVETLDNITFDGSTTYALTKSSSAYTPVSASSILISIDGVVQQGNFSVSTTNIVFDWSPTSSNTCNWIMHYGVGVSLTPSDDSVTGAKIADNAIDSEHYVDGSIDNAHIADNAIDSEHYADGSIDNAHIADNAIDSEHYADGSIDNAHIADDQIDSEHYAAASIDNEHLADNAVDTAEIADNAVTLAKMAGLARGKIIYGDASGNPAALAVGSNTQVLKSDGTDISWGTDSGGAALTGSTNNEIVTVTGANAIQGESSLTYDGNALTIANDAAASILKLQHTGGSNTGNTFIEWNTGGASSGLVGKTSGSDERFEIWNKSNDFLSLGTNNTLALKIDNTGAVTKPLQPAFGATKSTNTQSISAAYVSTSFNNELYDINGDWNTTTFTAPVTGKYQFNFSARINDIDGTATGSVGGRIQTSNRAYLGCWLSDFNDVFEDGDVAVWQINFSALCDMDANDVATFDVFSNGNDEISQDAEKTWVNGFLVC